MSRTNILDMPFILPSQAQKHVTHNEALQILDSTVQLVLEAAAHTVPPLSPVSGSAYGIGSGASDEWAGRDGQIAVWQDGAWRYILPRQGWSAFLKPASRTVVFDGADWVASALNSAQSFGINTNGDNTNRLAVKSDSVLMSHDDVTPGNGSIRLALNKSGSADTASLVFQSGWDGKAEIGLTGDNDFRIKVSDGAQWRVAMVIDPVTGEVLLPNTPASQQSTDPQFDGILTLSGAGGSSSQANQLKLHITTDPANPSLSALFFEPGIHFSRLFFGKPDNKFYALNLSNVVAIEGMPAFTTQDNLTFGANSVVSHNIGRAGGPLEYHACSPALAGHDFFVNNTGYSRTGESMAARINAAGMHVHGTISAEGPVLPGTCTATTLPAGAAAGSLVFVTNGAAGNPCIALFDGTQWLTLTAGAPVAG